ncbi:MAG: hypothetical protein ABEK16_04000 [Candidatus Nanohalobium sp.]
MASWQDWKPEAEVEAGDSEDSEESEEDKEFSDVVEDATQEPGRSVEKVLEDIDNVGDEINGEMSISSADVTSFARGFPGSTQRRKKALITGAARNGGRGDHEEVLDYFREELVEGRGVYDDEEEMLASFRQVFTDPDFEKYQVKSSSNPGLEHEYDKLKSFFRDPRENEFFADEDAVLQREEVFGEKYLVYRLGGRRNTGEEEASEYSQFKQEIDVQDIYEEGLAGKLRPDGRRSKGEVYIYIPQSELE